MTMGLGKAAHLARALCIAALLTGACAPSLPRPYLEAKAAGHRAYGAGRYDEAAKHFREAAAKAQRRKDRDEVLYLEAASYQRGGRHRDARESYEAMLELSPDGPRAARAAHEAARLEMRHGDEAKGWQMVHAAILRYPTSGLARAALLRYLGHLDETLGVERTIAYLEKGQPWFHAHDLGEATLYEKAKRFEQLERLEEARDGFLQCARRYPYPVGGLFDDALYRASLIEERLGRPRQAVEHLREMLRERERSTMHGSYERPRYSQAQMRIAVLHRDALGEPDTARREFRKLYDAFTTSILRDDALWAEALVAREQGDRSGACEAVTLLVKKLPDSRYAKCARVLCEDAPEPNPAGECRDYIAREVPR